MFGLFTLFSLGNQAFMRVSEFFGGLFTGLFSLVHRVVQPCSASEIPAFMQVSEFLRGLFTGLFACDAYPTHVKKILAHVILF